LGVNALIKEAGVGKKQVYEYFGGLAGVAEVWARERAVWPAMEELIAEPLQVFNERSPIEKLIVMNARYAEALRSRPKLAELVAGEFVKNSEIKEAIEHIRQLVRQDYERVLASDPKLTEPDFLAVSTVAYAAATYLGMRAHHQPRFFGFDLEAETPWRTVLHMFQRALSLADPERDKLP
jgi:AcrR family transcriptional regulator